MLQEKYQEKDPMPLLSYTTHGKNSMVVWTDCLVFEFHDWEGYTRLSLTTQKRENNHNGYYHECSRLGKQGQDLGWFMLACLALCPWACDCRKPSTLSRHLQECKIVTAFNSSDNLSVFFRVMCQECVQSFPCLALHRMHLSFWPWFKVAQTW